MYIIQYRDGKFLLNLMPLDENFVVYIHCTMTDLYLIYYQKYSQYRVSKILSFITKANLYLLIFYM